MPRRDERGLSESVQFAVVWPVLVLVTLGVLQAGLWLHGRNVALRAASAAVDAARGSSGSEAAAREAAVELARSGGLDVVSVDVVRGAVDVRATVTAASPLLLDLGLGELHETAAAPLERVTPP
ncbi:TadE-like protein [Friedmanniella luteola]|uniref:TadE-like protein n=1 Tax=Friedmanniella luteola TaxID=546871 RepID=A0A1H2A6J9_9ACTN|nr:TadE/TadG family type IV pilus assembly protein [Friedmanniella luteola]SDT41595.1 TadE-like protein [Friedmanniella luteola]